MPDTIDHGIYPYLEDSCGLELTLAAGQVTRIQGHAADVFSHGYICPKGAALRDLHEDPDRLRGPLIKRDGRFTEATWDEAFAEIERRLPPILAQHGRNAAAVTLGNPAAHKIGLLVYGMRFSPALRTQNIFSPSTLHQIPKPLSSGLMFCDFLCHPVPPTPHPAFLLILAPNPLFS